MSRIATAPRIRRRSERSPRKQALVFHFSVWISTLSVAFAALSASDPATLVAALPGAIRDRLPDVDGAAAQEGLLLLRAQVSLGLCEVIGPARLALTVAATPTVAAAARRNAAFAEAEASLNARLRGLLPGGGGGGDEEGA